MEKLTKTEEPLMNIIWALGKCLVSDIIERLEDDPKPPHSTVSSVVRILERKGYVGHKAYGKTHEYFPLITQEAYKAQQLNGIVNTYFDGSFSNLVSFFVKEQHLPEQEVEALLQQLKNAKK